MNVTTERRGHVVLIEHRVEPLPDVEPDFPPWLQDLRTHLSPTTHPNP